MWAFGALLGGFQFILGLMVMRVWKSVDDNTAAVTALAITLPDKYVTKAEMQKQDALLYELVKALHAHELKTGEDAHRA
jgi:hypothetical protein